MAKEKPLLDNLRYLFCKDASTGKQAGFNVQAVRDRLTEIQYDLDHIQGDIDQIINGDLSSIYEDVKNIYEKIENLKQQFNEFKVQIKQELDNFKLEIRNELAAEVNKIEQKITQINGRLDNLDAELAEVKRTYEHFPTGTKLLFYQKSAPPGWSVVQGLDDAILRVSTVKGGELVTGASFEQVFKSQDVGAGGEHDVSGQTSSVTVGVASTTASTSLTESQMPKHKHTGGVGGATADIGPRPYKGPRTNYTERLNIAQRIWDATQGIGIDTELDRDNQKEVKTGTAYVIAPQWQTNAMRFDEAFITQTNNDHTSTMRVTGWGMNLQPLDSVMGAPEAGGGAGHSHSYSFDAGEHSHSFNQHINAHAHSIDLTIKNISVIVCQKEVVF